MVLFAISADVGVGLVVWWSSAQVQYSEVIVFFQTYKLGIHKLVVGKEVSLLVVKRVYEELLAHRQDLVCQHFVDKRMHPLSIVFGDPGTP